MTQLITMQETNQLIMTRIHTILDLAQDTSMLNLTSPPRKLLAGALDDFIKAANANEALDQHQEIVVRLIDKNNQTKKIVIKTLLSAFIAIVALQKAAQQAAEELQIQNAINQVKANVQKLDSNNVDLLTPAIEQQIIACHEAIIAQKTKPAPRDASPASDNTSPKATSSAPLPHVTAAVATMAMSSQSDSHANRKPVGHDAPRPFPRSKPSGKRTSNVYTFNIPDRKVAATPPISTNSNHAIVTTLNLSPKAIAPKTQIDIFADNDNDNDLREPLLGNEYKLDVATPKKPILRVNIEPETPGVIRVKAIPQAKDKTRALQKANDKIALANTLYEILVRALYTHDALNFWSEQVTIGGKALDENIHARVKRFDDFTPANQTVAASMKLLVDTIGNANIGQMNKLIHLVELADTAAEQRFFCCFQPLGRTNASQTVYRTVGNIDLANLTAESVNDIRTKLESISPRLVEPKAEAFVQAQLNQPA